MKYKTPLDKFIEIYKRSNLSISKFSSLINRDRRVVTSWIDRTSKANINGTLRNKICTLFRYPEYIWEEGCYGDEFIKSISEIPKKEVKIIETDYKGRLKYIIKFEKDKRFVIQAQFPGPMYRDWAVKSAYRTSSVDKEVESFKLQRIEYMTKYDYDTTEWYSIKSILAFCFSNVGNFYTKPQRIEILEFMHSLFHNNYNKKLFLYDSHSRKLYGMETNYMSINAKDKIIFFKSPIEAVYIEINNKSLVERIHKYYSSPQIAPKHIDFLQSTKILEILITALKCNNNIKQAYNMINSQTKYGELFYHNMSIDLKGEL